MRVFLHASSRLTPKTARWDSPGGYGGEVTIDSEPGEGATIVFAVRVPPDKGRLSNRLISK